MDNSFGPRHSETSVGLNGPVQGAHIRVHGALIWSLRGARRPILLARLFARLMVRNADTPKRAKQWKSLSARRCSWMRGPPNLSCPHGARHSTLRPSWRDNATRFPNWNSIWSLELGTEPPLRATIMRYALCRIVRGYATGQKYLDIRLFLIQFSC